MAKQVMYVTGKDGGEARIEGDSATLDVIIAAIEVAGARRNESVGCWDFGFYESTPLTNAAREED